jgi:hypothetical protein
MEESPFDLAKPFTSIASQICSLAIRTIDASQPISAFPNLRHLSIVWLDGDFRLDSLRGLSLQTLFVQASSMSEPESSTYKQMVDIAKGEHEFIKVKKCYLCGDKKWRWGKWAPEPEELSLFGWYKEICPPHRGFKGPGS